MNLNKTRIKSAVVVITILGIITIVVCYSRTARIIYYTWEYDHAVITFEQGEIAAKVGRLNMKPYEFPEGTGIRYDLENYYLRSFRNSKENIIKYIGEPLITFKNHANDEYIIYWSRYFVFDEKNNLIATGMTQNTVPR